MPHSGIYKIENTITGAFYIGSAVDIKSRKRLHLHHLRSNKHHSPYMQRSFNKHGEAAFVWSVLEEVESKRDLLLERETYWVQQLKPQYNASTVSATRLGSKLTPEQIERLRKSQTPEDRKRQVEVRRSNNPSWHSIETRQKIKASRAKQETTPAMLEALKRGQEIRKQVNPKPRLGMKNSKEANQKISEAHLGMKHSEESKLKIREAKLGTKRSEEAKRKTSESLKGRVHSEETRQRIRESNQGLKRSEEARKNISQAHIGVGRSEESRRKQSETARANNLAKKLAKQQPQVIKQLPLF